ncbi:hypothetical protein BDN72DRAFT_600536 [Pluteus cervinus]|uniref:Uncharacterized protein n=1 Tax=Pluteus cervinus TaxID=181527 RepID=A0ACD3BA04_9AGAR|nr:hypothetical protein BDN72DRAFT_600536 [Pluteus cervinus]
MPVNTAAENIFGTLGAICWTVQLIPQIWKSKRDHSTKGLSPWLVLIWGLSTAPMGVYCIVKGLSVPLIAQPHLFGFFSLVSWGQCQYYSQGRTLFASACMTLFVISIVAGFEVGMVYALRPSFTQGNKKGVLSFGIMSSVLIAAGLLPQYYEIYKCNEVLGISMAFMTIDILGGVFSVISLTFKSDFETLACIAYSLVIVLDFVIVVAAFVLNPRAQRRRRQSLQLDSDDVYTTFVPLPSMSSCSRSNSNNPV